MNVTIRHQPWCRYWEEPPTLRMDIDCTCGAVPRGAIEAYEYSKAQRQRPPSSAVKTVEPAREVINWRMTWIILVLLGVLEIVVILAIGRAWGLV